MMQKYNYFGYIIEVRGKKHCCPIKIRLYNIIGHSFRVDPVFIQCCDASRRVAPDATVGPDDCAPGPTLLHLGFILTSPAKP